ncbi:MAG: hypothetical protein SWN98_14180 [Pseudomonadota bacterium]|jgi:protein ImuA|nr:hypothetical protein [Pseudomonadota bacterium]
MPADLSAHFPLRKSRVHEACGPGAPGFAGAVCAQGSGPVLWVVEAWRHEQVNPVAFGAFADPARLLVARAGDQREALAVAEVVLGDGAVPLVIVELGAPLSLKAGRRLQLAAKSGGTTGLCLIPEGMGSNAAETRWHCTPVFDASDSTRMRWELIKNKSGTLGVWDVRWDAAARRLDVVPPAGKRPGSQGAPG